MRLLVATPRFFPDTGGVERHVYETARRLADLGIDVTVLTADPTHARKSCEVIDGLIVRRVPARLGQTDFQLAPGIYGTVARGDWNLVHVQSWHTAVAPLAMLAAERNGIPYVVTPHGRGYASSLRKPLRPLQRRALGPLMRAARTVIALARFERDDLIRELKIPPSAVQVIPNGSDLDLRDVTPPPVAGDHVIASVGRLERFKGHHRIIQALPMVLNRDPAARLVIVGEGPYEPELRRLAMRLGVGDRVDFCYFAMSERRQLAQMLARVSLVVLLSEYETHPIAALEAAAMGKPLLVSDIAGMHELAEAQLGRAVSLESSPSDLAVEVLQQLQSPELPPPFGLPTWDACTDALLEVYLRHATLPGDLIACES